jgi:hypothetical protein
VARILGAFPGALLAASGGMSANQFYRDLQAVGYGARRSEVLALYKLARGIVARSPDEPFRPIHTAPGARELTDWPTRKATGVKQTVAITYRERATGTISRVWWSTVNPTAIAREEAMAQALDAYAEHAEQYNQELIGAVHTGAFRQIPER